MKSRRTFSSVLLAAVALGECGDTDESRTRNAAAPECRAPGTGPSSEAFLATSINEINALRSVHKQKIAAVEMAKQVLEKATTSDSGIIDVEISDTSPWFSIPIVLLAFLLLLILGWLVQVQRKKSV
jgi:hypothetical protein